MNCGVPSDLFTCNMPQILHVGKSFAPLLSGSGLSRWVLVRQICKTVAGGHGTLALRHEAENKPLKAGNPFSSFKVRALTSTYLDHTPKGTKTPLVPWIQIARAVWMIVAFGSCVSKGSHFLEVKRDSSAWTLRQSLGFVD